MDQKLRLLLIGLFSLFFTLSASARILDGKEVSRVITLKNNYGEQKILIHGYERDLEFMAKVEKVMLTDAVRLFDYFKTIPQDPVHIVIESEIQTANGMATPMPKNKIILYTFPPDADGLLLASDDWIRTLVLHELTHIIQGDMTTGFLGTLRNIFGSIFKWNLYTPRWFSEGIAVWAETTYTEGGRNRYVMNELALNSYLLNPDSCDDISCLDEGKIYPYAGSAYLLGGKFMEYVEKKSPGAIECLVRENSDNIPFILNRAFKTCFHQEIDFAFDQFIYLYKAHIRQLQSGFAKMDLASSSEVLPLKPMGEVYFDKGMELMNGKLYFPSYDHRIDYLNAFELKNKKTEKVKLEEKLEVLLPPTEASRRDQRYVVGHFDFDGDNYQKTWSVVDGNFKTLSTLEEDHPSSYIFWLNDRSYLSLRYQDNRWKLFNAQGEFYSLERFRALARPVVVSDGEGEFLAFKSYYLGQFSLQLIDLKNLTRKNLYRSDRPFNLVGNYQGYFFLNRPDDDSDKLLVLHLRHQNFTSHREKINELARLIFDDSTVLFTHRRDPNHVYRFKGSPEEFLAWLRAEGKADTTPKYVEVEKKAEDLQEKKNLKPYLRWSYLKPDYWMISGLFSGKQKETSVYATFSDPMENHLLDINATYYDLEKDFGGKLNYSYQFIDYTYLGVDFTRELNYSDRLEKGLSDEEGQVYLLSYLLTGRWSMPLQLSYKEERDSNSYTGKKEKTRTESFAIGVNHLPKFFDNFFNRFSLIGMVSRHHDEDIQYYSLDANGSLKLYFNSRWQAYLSGMWERNYKNSLEGSLVEYNKHFASISGGDIFGNTISYADFKLKALAKEIYRGWGNKPIFYRNVYLLGGIEAINADYIYVNNKLVYDETLSHAYAGVELGLRLFYFLDLSMQAVYGVLLNNGERDFSLGFTGEF